jgi:diaminopimelate epimerase
MDIANAMNSIGQYSSLGNRYWVLPFGNLIKGDDIIRLCSGCVADGVLVGTQTHENFFLRIFNADGSEAKISGNGVRIFAAHLAKLGLITMGETVPIIALSGSIPCIVHGVAHGIYDVSANLKISSCEASHIWQLDAQTPLTGYRVDLGNSHFIIASDSPRGQRLLLEHTAKNSNWTPVSINVHMLRVADTHNIHIRSWERGVGPTTSCGSGACACAFIARNFFDCQLAITVHMLGGDLEAKISGSSVTIRGPIKNANLKSNS